MEYIIDLPICYEKFDVFKQKATLILKSLFEVGRISDFMKFDNYGLISPLNEKSNQIKVEDTDKFVRGKTNCMIYNLTKNKYNPGIYDKLIIYYNAVSRDTQWYGYILYNTETKEMLHKYYFDYADDKLYHKIWDSFMILGKKKVFDFYSKKYDCIKAKDHANVKTLKDFKQLKKEMEDFKTEPFFIK
jgi:hypothetical protein